MEKRKIEKIFVIQFALAVGVLLLHNAFPSKEYTIENFMIAQNAVNNLLHGVVPFFFLLSGYLFGISFKDDYWEYIVKRIKTIVIPFVVWSLIFYILSNFISDYSDAVDKIDENPVIYMLHGTTGGLWFLRYLFLLQLCGLLLWKPISKSRKAGFAILAVCLVIGLIVQSKIPVLPTYYLPVYVLGMIMAVYYKETFAWGGGRGAHICFQQYSF